MKNVMYDMRLEQKKMTLKNMRRSEKLLLVRNAME